MNSVLMTYGNMYMYYTLAMQVNLEVTSISPAIELVSVQVNVS